jgi:hypothetical protein
MASFDDRRTILDGETYVMPQNGFLDIGAVSADITVSMLVGDGTAYREIGTVVSGNVMRANFVKGQVIKFEGSNAEITAFA